MVVSSTAARARATPRRRESHRASRRSTDLDRSQTPTRMVAIALARLSFCTWATDEAGIVAIPTVSERAAGRSRRPAARARWVLALLPRARTIRRTREKAACRPPAPLTGDELLAAVTEAMVAFHERYHHRKPVTAKTLAARRRPARLRARRRLHRRREDDDRAATHHDRPRNPQRLPKRHAAQVHRAVERLTGRHVLAFISNHHVGPDIEIELFMLTPIRLFVARERSRPALSRSARCPPR
jgi:hypothetical protein